MYFFEKLRELFPMPRGARAKCRNSVAERPQGGRRLQAREPIRHPPEQILVGKRADDPVELCAIQVDHADRPRASAVGEVSADPPGAPSGRITVTGADAGACERQPASAESSVL